MIILRLGNNLKCSRREGKQNREIKETEKEKYSNIYRERKRKIDRREQRCERNKLLVSA